MKASCLREDLWNAVSVTGSVAIGRTALPILQTIKIQAKNNKLILLGCDGEMWAEVDLVANVEEEGSICVSAKFLHDLISALSDGEVHIELKGNTLHLKNETSNWKLMSISAEEYPEPPVVEHNAELRLSMGELRHAINSVAYAVADDLSQPALSGVQFAYDGKRLTLVATDTFRLAIRHLEKEGIGSELTAIVPVKALRILKGLPILDPEEVALHFDSIRMVVDLGTTKITTQLLAGNYPNWRSVLPEEHTGSWTFDRLEFLDHVKRTLILARDNANRIQFTGMDGQIQIAASSEEKGHAKEEIAAVCRNSNFDVAFNGRYLIEALSSLEQEGIRAEFTEPNRPAVLKGVDSQDQHVCVIMPMAVG